ncbi:hypothetical protein ACDY95_09445, partial [Achromobacter ruhlandii]|uniref:hypothetical protein n=1 Tax=Achromobacter ruhlandii TaxID=72557 RepID=UPI003558BD4A
ITTQATTYAKNDRPRGRFFAGNANLSHAPRSSSASFLETGSPARGAQAVSAPSMRPTESEGKAEGLDEDEEGGGRLGKSGANAPDRNRWRAHRLRAP